jgi:hypothetical protein
LANVSEPVSQSGFSLLRRSIALLRFLKGVNRARKMTACIPAKRNRNVEIPNNAALYRQRHKIEIMF